MSAWLPGCVRQDFGTNGGSWTRAPAIICVHSTEGMSWPGYSGGSDAPHFTIDVRTGERRQHISMGVAARALKHPSGTPETNRAGVIQIETIGTCDPSHRGDSSWLYLPGMTQAQMMQLCQLMQDIANDQGIAWQSTVAWEPYPSPAYGSGYPRLSTSSFASYRGVLGHQHVPSNDHGDPGNLPMAAIMASLSPGSSSSYSEDDMILIYGRTPYLLSGGRLAAISEADRDRLTGAGVPAAGIDNATWPNLAAVFSANNDGAFYSKQVWERYSPGGQNLATWLGDIGQNVDWLVQALQQVAAGTGTRVGEPPTPVTDAGDTQDEDAPGDYSDAQPGGDEQ